MAGRFGRASSTPPHPISPHPADAQVPALQGRQLRALRWCEVRCLQPAGCCALQGVYQGSHRCPKHTPPAAGTRLPLQGTCPGARRAPFLTLLSGRGSTETPPRASGEAAGRAPGLQALAAEGGPSPCAAQATAPLCARPGCSRAPQPHPAPLSLTPPLRRAGLQQALRRGLPLLHRPGQLPRVHQHGA